MKVDEIEAMAREVEQRAALDRCLVVVSSAIPNCLCRRPKGHSGAHSEPVHTDDSFWTNVDIPRLIAALRELLAENKRLLSGDFTPEEFHNLCHKFSEADKEEFFRGCSVYQKQLFGEAEADNLRAENKRLQEKLDENGPLLEQIMDAEAKIRELDRKVLWRTDDLKLLRTENKRLERERDALGKAIALAAIKAGMIDGDQGLTGPQLLFLCAGLVKD